MAGIKTDVNRKSRLVSISDKLSASLICGLLVRPPPHTSLRHSRFASLVICMNAGGVGLSQIRSSTLQLSRNGPPNDYPCSVWLK